MFGISQKLLNNLIARGIFSNKRQLLSSANVQIRHIHYRPASVLQDLGAPRLMGTPPKCNNNLIFKRYKKRKARHSKVGGKGEDDEDDDDDDEDLSSENPLLVDDLLNPVSDGGTEMTIDVGSLRLDAFCKGAFGCSRAKVEETFYKGELYVNGERPAKKSVEVAQGDEVDLVRGISTEDTNLMRVNRALLTQIPDKATETGRMKLKIKRWIDLEIRSHTKKD